MKWSVFMDINILLFDDFETLDVFGSVEILGRLEGYELHFISMNGGVIKSRQRTEIVTQPVREIKANGILVIPGGQGTRALVNDIGYVNGLQEICPLLKNSMSILNCEKWFKVFFLCRISSSKYIYLQCDTVTDNKLEVDYNIKHKYVKKLTENRDSKTRRNIRCLIF